MFKLFLLFFINLPLYAGETCTSRGPNLIYVTMDGVRPYEFFDGTSPKLDQELPSSQRGEIMRHFWHEYASKGVVYGGRDAHRERFTIGSRIALSQPSYSAMFAGKPTPCLLNGCKRQKDETVFERIKRELKLEKKEIAVFASWDNIALTVESNEGSLTVNSGIKDFSDGSTDPFISLINLSQKNDVPVWDSARKDVYTMELALHYLKKHCPRVMFISFNDSDSWAHRNKYPEYVQAIKRYDDYLKRFMDTLDSMGDYGKNTTFFLSTDHGRGPGKMWYWHALTERNIFLYAKGPKTKELGRVDGEGRDQLYLRPTFEVLMGLKPSKDRVLSEVVGQ